MLAYSGWYSPAMLRNTVVLPLPDGPKIASTSPASHANATSSGIGPFWRSVTESLRSATARNDASRQHCGEHQRPYCNDQQGRRHHTGAPIVERVHAIVDRHTEGSRMARKI